MKLRIIRPLVSTAPPLIARQDRDTARAVDQPWRRWYFTHRWHKLRAAIRERDLFTCGICCQVATGKGMAVVDHRVPHHGDEGLFWDEDNLWTLCKPCHDGVKQREDRAARRW